MEGRLGICPLIDFRDVWEKCFTKPFDFTQVMKHDTLEELETLRLLSAKRSNALENRTLGDVELTERRDRIEDYLFHVMDLKAKSEAYWMKNTERRLNFYWTSPMAERRDFIQLRGIDLEISMVMFIYGCVSLHWSYESAEELVDTSGDRAARILECVKGLRTTAGIFKYIHTTIAESTAELIESLPNSPAELVPAMSQCFERICLGQAQALAAYRALQKQTTSSVMTTVHVGAADLFESASSTLKENTGKFNIISDRLRRFIALSSSLEEIRAYQQTAATQNAKGQSGLAVAFCKKALSLLETCLTVAEVDEQWTSVCHQEKEFVESIERIYDQDRVSVYYQQVADHAPRLSDGKSLVETIDLVLPQKTPFL